MAVSHVSHSQNGLSGTFAIWLYAYRKDFHSTILTLTDDPNGVHGIGLPTGFVPPGQPLLNEQENDQMQDFFAAFEGDQIQVQQQMHGHFQDNMAQIPHLQMPQQYVGHETYVRSPQSAMDWHPQMTNFGFQQQMHPAMPNMHTPTSPFTNGHGQPMFSPMQTMQGFTQEWQQPFQHPPPVTRAEMHFGTDPSFGHVGPFVAPDGATEPEMNFMGQSMYPVSSASNTHPNSRAGSNAGSNVNTEPSSPVTTKKRKLNNVFQSDSLRMTSMNGGSKNGVTTKGSPPPPTRRKSRQSFIKNEQPPMQLSKTPIVQENEVDEDDAEYDEDEEEEQEADASPPAPWPSSKARPLHKPPPPPKPPKPRKKSTSAGSPTKTPKARRQSSSTNANARVPLTAEQKKANHTNSEQRRRDATAKAYADLYDLVPELGEMGKQSTMKKLEIVVDKVRSVKQQIEYVRSLMGRDPITGRVNTSQISATHYVGDLNHLSGWR